MWSIPYALLSQRRVLQSVPQQYADAPRNAAYFVLSEKNSRVVLESLS